MYIRTRDEALDALASALQKPERREQIIDVTVKIMLCLHPDPRQLLYDGQVGLIEGGLSDMAKKRRELLEAAQTEELILIVNPEEERVYDSVGRALDALRVGKVAAEVFPALAPDFETWEFARTVLTNEEAVRACLVETVRARNTPQADEALQSGQKKMSAWLEQARPPWRDRLDSLRAACGESDAELVNVIAVDDERATRAFELIKQSSPELTTFLAQLRDIIQTIRRLEQDADTKSAPRVA